jgi:hypothetical protein
MARACAAILILALGAIPALAGTTFISGGITITTSNQRILGGSINGGFYPGYFNGIGICSPHDWRSRLMFRRDGSWFWRDFSDDGIPLIETVRREDPALVEAIIGPTMPDPDPALITLRAGRYLDAAAEFLRRHHRRLDAEQSTTIGTPIPDRSALRLHGLALAGARDFPAAAAAFAEAHAEDDLLGADPIDAARIMPSLSEMRRIVIDAVQFAHRTNTPDAWALVGYLMQAQGRHNEARAMLARAESMR